MSHVLKKYNAPFKVPDDHARMKDLQFLALMVALHNDLFRTQSAFIFHVMFSQPLKKGFKATLLELHEHARMRDLKFLILMEALETLHDFPDPCATQCSF